MSPKRKVTLYFNSGMLAETQREAIRQDRSVSWIIQAAWKIARDDVRRLPAVGTPNTPAAATTITSVAADATAAVVEPVRASATAGAPPRRTVRE
jgi:uncharacterized small protein (TIGR04563 family)